MFKLIIVGLVLTVASVFVMSKIDPNVNHDKGDQATATTVTGKEVKVVITGQILHPGEYLVLPNETLGDLIAKAGGLLADADSSTYTEGLLIGTYSEFYIAPKSKTPDACIVERVEKYNVNTANEDQLKKIGLTSSQAASLISYRSANGSFLTIEDIKLVTGIGEKTYLAVRDYLTLK